MRQVLALILSSLVLAKNALASDSFESLTSAGAANFTESLTYVGSEDERKTEGAWNWNLGYTYSHLSLPASPGVATTSDNAQEFVGGLGFRNKWDTGLNLTYAFTPEEKLQDVGPTFFLGYEWGEGKKKQSEETSEGAKDSASQEEDSESFFPSFELKGIAGFFSYTESFGQPTRSRRGAASTASQEDIVQSSLGAEGDYTPLEWLSLRISYIHHSYDKDVSQFLSFLNNPRAVTTGASSFSSTLAGFSKYDLVFGAIFAFSDAEWSLEPEYVHSKSAIDDSLSNGEKIMIGRVISAAWSVALGFEHDSSASQGVQNLGLLRLSYGL